METITVNGKNVKVVKYLEIDGRAMTSLLASNVKDNDIDIKAISWQVATMAGLNGYTVWENGMDYSVGFKLFDMWKYVRSQGKKMRVYRLAFTSDDMYIVRNDGTVYL